MIDRELIGRGRTAEVYAEGVDRAVKVLLPGFDPAALASEARKTQAAHDAGVLAPRTYGSVVIDGRFGCIFDRVDGELMLDALKRQLWRYGRHSDLLAAIHADMHSKSSNALPDVRERLAAQIDRATLLDRSLRRMAKDRLLGLDSGDRVLHGDLHPGNVVLGDSGPVVIDWLDAARGSPAADVARSLWLLSPPVIEPGVRGRRILSAFLDAFRHRYLRRYMAATNLDAAEIHSWRLPVLTARLAEGISYETDPLMAEVKRLANP